VNPLLLVILLNTLIVGLAVLIHYEVLYRMARRMPTLDVPHRYRVLVGVCVIMAVHIVEIWLFAGTYFGLIQLDDMGDLEGLNRKLSLLECSYFSLITFTTVGYGDIHPTGYLRYLSGLESLTGFVLITWSASFLFLEMQKYWPNQEPR